MKIYKHWARAEETAEVDGHAWQLRKYGASNHSFERALEEANRSLRALAVKVRGGEMPNSYGYSDRPVREELVEVLSEDPECGAVITRNAYGCLVLNTSGLFFADIDLPLPRAWAGLGAFFRKLTGKPPEPDPAEGILERIRQTTESRPGLGLRVYRTAAGFRCLATSGLFDPVARSTHALLEALGGDPLYARLCRVQESFRARLTPKCWRCRVLRPPYRYPYRDAKEQAEMNRWVSEYNDVISGYGVCRYVGSFGETAIHHSVDSLVQLHDGVVLKDGLQLA